MSITKNAKVKDQEETQRTTYGTRDWDQVWWGQRPRASIALPTWSSHLASDCQLLQVLVLTLPSLALKFSHSTLLLKCILLISTQKVSFGRFVLSGPGIGPSCILSLSLRLQKAVHLLPFRSHPMSAPWWGFHFCPRWVYLLRLDLSSNLEQNNNNKLENRNISLKPF